MSKEERPEWTKLKRVERHTNENDEPIIGGISSEDQYRSSYARLTAGEETSMDDQIAEEPLK